MNAISNYNLTKEDALGVMRRANVSDHPERGIRINAVYTICNNEWKFLVGRCAPDQPCYNDLHQIYQDHVFISKVVAGLRYADLMDRLHADGVIIDPGLPPIKVIQGAKWTHNIIPSSHSQVEAPVQRFWIGCESQSMFWSGKLIKHGLPFHRSSTKYIKEFLGLEDFHGNQDSRKGAIILDVPEARGRILLKDNKLSIDSHVVDLCIVGQVASGPAITLLGSEAYSVAPQDLNEAEFWLISKDDQIIDFISSSEMPPKNVQPTEVDYEALIVRGECDGCELKPYISLRHSKAEELLKATCALSNSRGGYVFIGVSDDIQILGIPDSELQRDYKTDPDAALGKYQLEIRGLLREGLRDNQCFTTDVLAIAGRRILMIKVAPSEGLNYLRAKQDAYVRRGASSARMTPEEIRVHGRPNHLEGFLGTL